MKEWTVHNTKQMQKGNLKFILKGLNKKGQHIKIAKNHFLFCAYEWKPLLHIGNQKREDIIFSPELLYTFPCNLSLCSKNSFLILLVF